MASYDPSSNPKILLDDEEDFQDAFAALARAPLPMRAAYASRLRGTLRDELAAQAARRARPWWLAWAPQRDPLPRSAQPRPAFGGLRFAMAGIAAVMILLLAGITMMQIDPLGTSAQAATVSVKAGEIRVSRPIRVIVDMGLTRRFTISPAETARLRSGDELSSDAAAEAEIVLPDGSRMTVGPGVELSIEELQARTTSKPLVVAMHLERGEIQSEVKKLRSDTERFEVSTANLIAHVKGTVFRVDVRPIGTRVATDQGLVQVKLNGQTVDVEAGRELLVLLDQSVPEISVRPQSPQLTCDCPADAIEAEADGGARIFTNREAISWRVRTLPGARVAFYVDDTLASTVTADDTGNASIQFSPTAEGAYRITAVMQTLTGEQSLPSLAQAVIVDRTPPSLLLTSPAEPQVETSTVTVAGRTEPGVRLELNGQSVAVDGDGNFAQSQSLTPGANVITLVGTDRAGNSITLQSVIVYETTVG